MSYLSALAPLPTESGSPAPLAPAEASAIDDAAGLQSVLVGINAALASRSTVLVGLKRDLESRRSSEPPRQPAELDQAIEILWRLEQRHAADHDRVLRLAETMIARASRLPPDSGKALADIARAAAYTHAAFLEGLRDARWELLAQRAADEPSPVADTAESFDAYLERLLGS